MQGVCQNGVTWQRALFLVFSSCFEYRLFSPCGACSGRRLLKLSTFYIFIFKCGIINNTTALIA